jgi:erythromycin esterase-like protein
MTEQQINNTLLLKCVDTKAAICHRFGTAMWDVKTNEELFEYLKAYDDNEAEIACVAYDSEAHLHTITLNRNELCGLMLNTRIAG